jgi:hypothetical protein
MAEDDKPNGGPTELPSDYREFRRSYRWLLLYGPWALSFIGLLMVAIGLFADRPGEVALTAIGFGAAMFIAGVLLPRMRGPLEFGPGGVKGAIEGLPLALMVAAVAREAAEQAIPEDAPDKERKVNEVVGHTVSELPFTIWQANVTDEIYSQAVRGIPEKTRRARMEAMRRRLDEAAARKREEDARNEEILRRMNEAAARSRAEAASPTDIGKDDGEPDD